MNRFALFLYRIFIVPPMVLALPLLALFSQKIRDGLRLRRRKIEAFNVRPIWIHAASGEFEYAKAVIRELKLRYPSFPIVVTYFSPTFAKSVENFPGVEQALALPLDLPGPLLSFMRRIRPRALLVARTDLWPEVLEQCRRAKVPVTLFSYTQRQFGSPFKKWLTRWLLDSIENVYCVAASDQQNLLLIGRKAEVLGDTRYDQVAERLSHPKPLPAELRPTGTPVLVAGSTWSEDESVLLPGLSAFIKAGRLKLILVPHEPTPQHLAELKGRLHQLEMNFTLFSERRPWSSILVVDQVGVLAELYQWGDYAFIGGSFRGSVHSVMEALGAGCRTLVGPFHHNNREALEFQTLQLAGESGVEVVRDQTGLTARMQTWLDHPNRQFHEALRTEFSRRLGASARLVDRLHDSLI